MCEKGRKSVQDGWVLNEVMRPVAAQWKHNGSTELRNVTVIPTPPAFVIIIIRLLVIFSPSLLLVICIFRHASVSSTHPPTIPTSKAPHHPPPIHSL